MTNKKQSISIELITQKPLEFVVGLIALFALLFIAARTSFFFMKQAFNQASNKKTEVTTPNKNNPTPKSKEKYYVVQENESLWDVAAKVYNDPYQFTKILELNKLENPNVIENGTRLRID